MERESAGFASPVSKRLSHYLPRLGLASLILSILSGLVLSFYYRPMGDVFRNVEEITTLVPYGWFFRQFHHIAGQVFVILMLIHTADHFIKRRYRSYESKQWVLLVLSLCLCFLVLFTGFVLKGDKEGFFAGQILMNILGTIPAAGDWISRLFIVPGEDFFFLPYLYHAFFLPILILFLIRFHIRDWLPDRSTFALTFFCLLLYSVVVKPQVDVPPEAQVAVVKGPWFFLGIQSMLKIMPTFLGSVVIPVFFVGAVFLLPLAGRTWGRRLHYLIAVLGCLYALMTVRALIWSP